MLDSFLNKQACSGRRKLPHFHLLRVRSIDDQLMIGHLYCFHTLTDEINEALLDLIGLTFSRHFATARGHK